MAAVVADTSPNDPRMLGRILADRPTRSSQAPVDGFGAFLKRSRHRILSAEEERAFGARIAGGRDAADALEFGDDLTAGERRRLQRLVDDGTRAQEELARFNLRLVISMAKRYRGRGLDLDDLIQEGYLGLVRAAEKFDHTRGYKFSTYACWWIRQAIGRAINDKGQTIRLPANAVEVLRKVRSARDLLLAEHGEASMADIAEQAGVPERTAADLLLLDLGTSSLDDPVGESGTTLGELVADRDRPAPEDLAVTSAWSAEIDDALTSLSDREEAVLRMRFGLDDGVGRTLEEIGREFGVSRERIRQIESRALKRLRRNQVRALLEPVG